MGDTLRIQKMVYEHDMAIKNQAAEIKEIRDSLHSIKEPIQHIQTSIASITANHAIITPLIENYSLAKKWWLRVCIFVTISCGIYLLFGSNAIKIIKFFYDAWLAK